MASTEALDQVADQTSTLDISNGKNESESKESSPEPSKDAKETPAKPSAAKRDSSCSANSKESSPPAQTDANKSSTPATTVKSLPKAFRDNFKLFSKFGDTKSDGKQVTLSQSDKWMKQAKVIDGKKITTTDTGICFKKFKSLKISLSDYHKFIQSLTQYKNIPEDDLIQKMAECGAPGTNLSTSSPAQIQDTISRLTDTSRYTGSHKLRFDESGKGKGLAGRTDVVEGARAGYVHGYSMRNSYDKSH